MKFTNKLKYCLAFGLAFLSGGCSSQNLIKDVSKEDIFTSKVHLTPKRMKTLNVGSNSLICRNLPGKYYAASRDVADLDFWHSYLCGAIEYKKVGKGKIKQSPTSYFPLSSNITCYNNQYSGFAVDREGNKYNIKGHSVYSPKSMLKFLKIIDQHNGDGIIDSKEVNNVVRLLEQKVISESK